MVSDWQKSKLYIFLLGIGMGMLGLLFIFLAWQLRFLAGAISAAGMLLCFFTWAAGRPGTGLRILRSLLLLSVGSFLAVEFLVFQAMSSKEAVVPEVVIVLGAKVNGSQPSIALQDRLQAAIHCLQASPKTIAVVSGGQGPGEEITEGEAMREYLVQHGISGQRILTESQSRTTQENLQYSCQVLEQAGIHPQTVGIVTSDYHIFRACWLARRYFPYAFGLAGKSEAGMRLNYAIREYFAVIKMIQELAEAEISLAAGRRSAIQIAANNRQVPAYCSAVIGFPSSSTEISSEVRGSA